MRFADPSVLIFLVFPLLAAVVLLAGIWVRRRTIHQVGAPATVEQQLVRPSPYARAAKGILLVLGLAALVVGAARPQYGGRIQMLKKRGIDVVVALDFSKSMLAQDVQPNRLERAKLELAQFIEQLTGDRIGLVAFAGDTQRFPLTSDYSAATAFWKGLGPYDMPVGGTAIGRALTAATRMLTPQNEEQRERLADRSKAIVLITDGEDHLGDPVAAAQEAAKQGIVIHVLGIGSDSPELIPLYTDDGTVLGYQKSADGQYVTTALSGENERQLQEIAETASGRYIRAGSDMRGMNSIVQEIRKLKQSEVQARQITVYEEVFQWFLIPALFLLLGSFLLPERRRRSTQKEAQR